MAGSTSRCASGASGQLGSSENMVMWRSVVGSCRAEAVREVDGRVQGRHVERSAARQGAARETEGSRRRLLRQVRRRRHSSPTSLPFSSKPVSKCSELYPVYSNPRQGSRRAAGGQHPEVPVEAGRCEGLPRAFTPAEMARLKAHFRRRRLRLVEAGRESDAGRRRGRRSARRRRTWCSRSAARSPARGNHEEGTQSPLGTRIH